MRWSVSDMLLNKAAYYLEVLAWQQTQDATHKPPRNVPVYHLLPGVEEQKPKANPEQESMDIDDIKAYLSRPRESVMV